MFLSPAAREVDATAELNARDEARAKRKAKQRGRIELGGLLNRRKYDCECGFFGRTLPAIITEDYRE